MTFVSIRNRSTRDVIAQGPRGWPITPFEGNFYIQRKLVRVGKFVPNYIPGICPYKFLYIWMDYISPSGDRIKNFGWMYVLANPLFPFIWFRIGISQNHPEIEISISENERKA